ncbi:MAG TPA: hypothetical protein VFV91_04915 [Gaiellaceae bacterium]|jgi:hypothetical protein|nr:hypothetical protein [Gaiellaceae bacterium]
MLLKIFLVGAVLIGVMAAIKDGRVLKDAGLLSSCTAVVSDGKSSETEMSCSKGRLDGWPDLTNKSCTVISLGSKHEYWRCLAPVVSSQTPNG